MTQAVSNRHAIAFSAPHAQAANIGLDVLREGGSAVDAMIAAAAAITRTAVPQPMSATLAGRKPPSYSRSNARKQPSVVP